MHVLPGLERSGGHARGYKTAMIDRTQVQLSASKSAFCLKCHEDRALSDGATRGRVDWCRSSR
jgi:hypothetical protein